MEGCSSKEWNLHLDEQKSKFCPYFGRLDRHLIGESWLESSFQVEALILPISLSDHFPVELKLSEVPTKGSSSFKFLSMWWRDPEFTSHLQQWWIESNTFRGSPSYCVVKRLKFPKEKIKNWNRESFKNIFAERNRIEEELNQINLTTIISGMTNDAYHKEVSLCKAEKSNPSCSPLPNSKEREGRVTRVDGFHLGETLHSKEGLKPTRSNPTQCKIGS
ncbi:hypothetical protein SUGI_0932890 [Cryptomeria japonica]|nr:hypothetical protein SUGI_0932890 [Cryptomeria japonica]